MLLAAIAYFYFFGTPGKNPMSHPGKKELHKIFKDNVDESIKFLGAKLNARLWYNAYPIMSMRHVAHVVRIDNQGDIDQWMKMTEEQKNKLIKKGEKEPKPVETKYLLIKGCRPDLISEIFYSLLRVGAIRMLVKADQLDKQYQTFYLKEGLTPRTYGKVWIVDKAGKEFMEDISWKFAVEDIMEQQANYSKRVSFLSPQLASVVAQAEAKAEIEKNRWASDKDQRYR